MTKMKKEEITMMKKEYIAPTIEVVEMDEICLVTGSWEDGGDTGGDFGEEPDEIGGHRGDVFHRDHRRQIRAIQFFREDILRQERGVFFDIVTGEIVHSTHLDHFSILCIFCQPSL